MSSSIEDFFQYRSGQFCCEDVDLASIAGRFGTPAYIYSQSTILRNYERLRGTMAHIPGLICYSVKANSHLRILGLLRQAGAGFDVVSGGELARALRAGDIAAICESECTPLTFDYFRSNLIAIAEGAEVCLRTLYAAAIACQKDLTLVGSIFGEGEGKLSESEQALVDACEGRK